MLVSIAIALLSCIVFLGIARKNEKSDSQKKSQDKTDTEKSPFQILPAIKFAMLLILAFGRKYKWYLVYDGSHVMVKFHLEPFRLYCDVNGYANTTNSPDMKKVENNFDLVYQFRDVLSKEEFKLALELLCKEEK